MDAILIAAGSWIVGFVGGFGVGFLAAAGASYREMRRRQRAAQAAIARATRDLEKLEALARHKGGYHDD